MGSVDPQAEQLEKAIRKVPPGVPVVMLNMLKFREIAQYQDDQKEGEKAVSGRAAYATYSAAAAHCVERVGGELLWAGDVASTLIGPDSERWDVVMLVRYPAIEKFVEMITSAEYRRIMRHRTAALEDSRLVATVERS
jgi:uncharacterized protein (DUF1330 family)